MRLYNLVDYFYKLAVPVEEVFVGKERDDVKKFDQFRKEETIGRQPIRVEDYFKLFQGTAINYRIFYLSDWMENALSRASSFSGDWTSEPYSLEWAVDSFNKVRELVAEMPEEVRAGRLAEVDSLVSKLSAGAINVFHIVDESVGFEVTPSGLMHDVGHRFILLARDELRALVEPLKLDYNVYVNSKRVEAEISDAKALRMLEAILATGFGEASSISRKNLRGRQVDDLLPDLLVEYHIEGDKLLEMAGRKLHPLVFYSEWVGGRLGGSTKLRAPVTGEYAELRADNLDHVERRIEELDFYSKLGQEVGEELRSFIGKVVIAN